jgi:hypothetical protein
MKIEKIGDARKRRALIRSHYVDPIDAMAEMFEASWRSVWAECCAEMGEQIPFEKWFFEFKDKDGRTPFDVAGVWFKGREG